MAVSVNYMTVSVDYMAVSVNYMAVSGDYMAVSVNYITVSVNYMAVSVNFFCRLSILLLMIAYDAAAIWQAIMFSWTFLIILLIKIKKLTVLSGELISKYKCWVLFVNNLCSFELVN